MCIVCGGDHSVTACPKIANHQQSLRGDGEPDSQKIAGFKITTTLTLRDRFAMAALTVIISCNPICSPEEAAQSSYLLADAVLVARERK